MIDLKTVCDPGLGEEFLETPLTGHWLLECPLLNKGSAFTEEERRDLGLLGLLPPHVSSLEEQVARRYLEYRQKPNDLERYIFLRALQDRNETLFYRLFQEHIAEMLPVVYTPAVGTACQHYSAIYRRPRGLYIPFTQRDQLDAILANRPYREVDVIVVTDGERILGLGDQGVGGMGIPVGKLSLYTLCGGIQPARTLPILLDVGTDNPELLADSLYLGWRHSRVRGEPYDAFVEDFIQALERHLPGVLLQWEDFGRGNAHRLLERYRDRICSFNDDIQGTAAVALAGLFAALRRTDSRLAEQRIVILGAGSAGTGIADQIVSALRQEGLSPAEARQRLWLVDRCGLLHTGLPDLAPFQGCHCQPAERIAGWARDGAGSIPLREVVRHVHPTVLIGVSGQPGVFTEDVVRTMAAHVERPVIFPLSNPTSHSEATPADLLAWTGGRAFVATGSPFPDVVHGGREVSVSQCNNVYIFPGVGLGVIASGARRVTDEMFLAAARALSDCSAAQPDTGATLFPLLTELGAVARQIALAVGAEAMRQGVARALPAQLWERRVDGLRWEPRYRPVRRTLTARPDP
jgi:malate dehydrogenase (oxaloacetate-decarboxylating)